MRNLFFVLLASAFLFSCGNKSEEGVITDLDINTFTEEAGNYVDQEITITGTCVHICKHGGKKMHLIGDNDEKKLVVFTGEGVSEFPMELEGLLLKVTGKVVEEIYTEETILEWEAADAKAAEEAEAEEVVEEGLADGEDIEVAEGENIEVNADDAEQVAEVEIDEDITLEEDLDEEEVVEATEEETHACADEAGDPYAKLREQISESEDGKVRMYFIEVTAFEEVK